MLWILPCFMVVLMQAGFALLETGLCRAKNAAHTMSMNFLAYALGITAFWALGFALMCGGAGHISQFHSVGAWGHLPTISGMSNIWGFRAAGHWWGIVGGKGFFLSGHLPDDQRNAMIAAFLCMTSYMSVAVTIPTGALVERWSIRSFALFTLLNGGLIFPIFGCWMWGGGWLAQLGHHLGLGSGAIDYGGSGVVHLLGGTLALVGVIQVGPRIGKYDESQRPRLIFGHHVPMVIQGTLMLGFCWFGFNTGPIVCCQRRTGRSDRRQHDACVGGRCFGVGGLYVEGVWEARSIPDVQRNAGVVASCPVAPTSNRGPRFWWVELAASCPHGACSFWNIAESMTPWVQ